MDKLWARLESECPIDISRLKVQAQEMESHLPRRIDSDNLNECKESLFLAQACLDSLVTVLSQSLSDKELFIKPTDILIRNILLEDMARYLRRIEKEGFDLIVKFDAMEGIKSEVGVIRISAYSKVLQTALDSVIYESLLKASKEYIKIEETETIKKNKRAFLYILFQILEVTFMVVGGSARDSSSQQKTQFSSIKSMSPSWSALMSNKGEEAIRKSYKNETGKDLSEIDDSFLSLQDEYEEEDNA